MRLCTSSIPYVVPSGSIKSFCCILLFGSLTPQIQGDSSPQSHSHSGGGHTLVFDEKLGMFAHSDHADIEYPFSEEALAQSVPTLDFVIQHAGEPGSGDDSFIGSKQLVHQDSEATDSNANMIKDENGNWWIAYTSFRKGVENIYIKQRGSNGRWSSETQLSDSPGSDFDPVLGFDEKGKLWCIWSQQGQRERWPIVARSYDGSSWSKEQTLAAGKNYYPALARLSNSGELVLAWEDWNAKESRISTSRLSNGEWSDPVTLGDGNISHQRPTLAADDNGNVWLAYDVVLNQKYELRLAQLSGNQWVQQPPPPEINGHRRRASMAVDAEGRVWVLPETEVIEPLQLRQAWNGQDVIYNVRPPSRAMLIWNGKAWKALPPGPALSPKAATLHIDSQGSVWMFGRTPGPGTRDFLLVGQRYRGSEYYVDSLDEGPWDGNMAGTLRFDVGDPSVGSIKETVSVVEGEDRIYVAWHETHRQFVMDPGWSYMDGPVDTIVHSLDMEAEDYVSAKIVDYDPTYHGTDSPEVTPLPHADQPKPEERVQIDGEWMKAYYGDMHHHTEYSRDPGVMNDDVDGNYRYVRDIRQFDFQGLADHAEHINPHDWYRIRRAAAFYNHGNHFAAMVAFEWTSEFYRGGNYQEGHHNIVYRSDGPEAKVFSASLPESNTPLRLTERIEEEMVAARLKNIKSNMLIFPHDPSRWVQPISWSWYSPKIRLLELVQSRGNHEHLGSPQLTPLRNDFQQILKGKSAQDGLEKGFRWGFIGSGDHRGAPVAGVYSPAGDRGSIFDSLYMKRTFATTGAHMMIDVSINGNRMGSEWRGRETEHTIDIYAKGTKPITFVELWKNGRMLWRWSPEERSNEYRVSHKDPSAPFFRENYWYARITQEDGEMVWSSPAWYVYDGIEAEVLSDVGGPEPHYMTPDYPIPIPVLMRNQGDETVEGKLTLSDLPDGWVLEPNDSINMVLPPDSWTTYVWYVTAPKDSIDSLKAFDLKLQVDLEGEDRRFHRVPCVQSPYELNTRGQLSELNDAVYMLTDLKQLNKWLATMEERWFGNE